MLYNEKETLKRQEFAIKFASCRERNGYVYGSGAYIY